MHELNLNFNCEPNPGTNYAPHLLDQKNLIYSIKYILEMTEKKSYFKNGPTT